MIITNKEALSLESTSPGILSNYEKINLLVIGDPHGEKVEFDPTLYDHVILLGDYVDSYHIKSEDIFHTFHYYIHMAKQYSNIQLLLGNHDIMYYFYSPTSIYDLKYGCSGFRQGMAKRLRKIFMQNKFLFKAAFQIDNVLFTHAGISQKFFNNHLVSKDIPKDLFAEALNKMFLVEQPCLFNVGKIRDGDSEVGGIFWADKTETENDPLEGFLQIVGHTPTLTPEPIEVPGFIYADTKTHKNEITLWRLK